MCNQPAQRRNKNILLIAHSATNRAVQSYMRGLSNVKAFALPFQANKAQMRPPSGCLLETDDFGFKLGDVFVQLRG